MNEKEKCELANMLLTKFRVVIPCSTNYTSTCAELRVGSNKLTLNRITLAELGYPEYICLLISEDFTQMVVQRCDENKFSVRCCEQDESGRVSTKSVVLTNSELVRNIRKKMGWEAKGKTYVVPAVKNLEIGMLLFDFKEAWASNRGANLKKKYTANILDTYPPVSQVLNSFKQVSLPASGSKAKRYNSQATIIDVDAISV